MIVISTWVHMIMGIYFPKVVSLALIIIPHLDINIPPEDFMGLKVGLLS